MSETPAATETRPSLLLRIRDPADAASWHAFVDAYAPLVYGYGRRRGLQDADAADLTQDALAEVARCIRSFEYRPERGRFRDWLGLLIRRKLSKRLRQTTREPAAVARCEAGGFEAVDVADTDAEWDDEFNARILQAALDRCRPHFEPSTWQAFQAVWIDRKSASQAARDLAVPIDAIYLAKSRVLKRLEAEVLILAEDAPEWMQYR